MANVSKQIRVFDKNFSSFVRMYKSFLKGFVHSVLLKLFSTFHLLYVFLFLICFHESYALTFQYNPNTRAVGKNFTTHPLSGESLREMGLRFGIGLKPMLDTNPQIEPDMPLSNRQSIYIPGRIELPKIRQGVVIRLEDYRLFYFPKNENVLHSFPIGIGKKKWETPKGTTYITKKVVSPNWHPSQAIQKNASRHGILLPDEIPAGITNPLGKYVLRLAWSGYLIHSAIGTWGIGENVTAGCIRLLAEDMEYLFHIVPTGTKVVII